MHSAVVDGPDLEELLYQMRERSEQKLRLPKNTAKPSWLLDSDRQLLRRVFEERREQLEAINNLVDYLNLCEVGWEGPVGTGPVSGGFPPTLQSMWNRIADEAQDVYAMSSMGADPRRFARRLP